MFYVYVHRRADTGATFYVGKGSGGRIRCKQGRNPYWLRVAQKAGGYLAEKVIRDVDEELAHLVEAELIDQLRRCGLRLTNMTDGGEGMSGYRRSSESIERGASKMRGRPNTKAAEALRGRPKSAEHRAKMSAARKGKKATAETRAKLSAANKGRLSPLRGTHISEEHRAKIRAAAPRGESHPFFGRTHSPDVIEKIRAANIGRRDTTETRAKKSASKIGKPGNAHGMRHTEEWKRQMSAANTGAGNPRFGSTVTSEQRERQAATMRANLAASRTACPHCGIVCDKNNAKRWHFDNCKAR